MSAKKIIVGIPAYRFMKIVKYLKSIADTSVIACDEIVVVMDILSTKITNNIATSTVPINSHGEKVRYKIDC